MNKSKWVAAFGIFLLPGGALFSPLFVLYQLLKKKEDSNA